MGRGVLVTDEQLHIYSGVRVRIPDGDVRLVTRRRVSHIGWGEPVIEIQARRIDRRSGQKSTRVRVGTEFAKAFPVQAAEHLAQEIRIRLGLPGLDFTKGRFGW